MSMHYWMPLPRQEGSFITSIGGKRCTAVPRNVQQSKPPSPAQPVTSQPEPLRASAPPADVTSAPGNASPTSPQQIVAPITQASRTISDQVTEPLPLPTAATGTPTDGELGRILYVLCL